MVDLFPSETVAIAELLMLMTTLALYILHVNGRVTQQRSFHGGRDFGGDAGTMGIDVE